MKTEFKVSRDILIAISGFALFTFCLHLFTNIFAGYGIFRDELYYIACSKRLAAGYVDQPPFSIFALYLIRQVLGDSVFAIRFIPALVSAAVVFITGVISLRLNGGIYAAALACTAMTFAPIFIAMNAVYSMNTFDYLFWVLAAYIIVLLIQREKNFYWYMLGIAAGLGLLNKTGFLWFGAGLFIGLLITQPKVFLRKEVYIAGILALVIFSPYIIWNITHDFAHLEFIRNATRYKYSVITRTDFIIGQIILLNPVSIIVALGGLYYLLFNNEGKKYRILGIIFIVSFLVLLVNGKSKPEYLGTAYAPIFAAGGVFFEKLFARRNILGLKYILPVLIAALSFLFMPEFLPVLPVESFLKYQKTLGIEPSSNEGNELSGLPQFYADMFGWENMAKTVSDIYMKLSDEEKQNTIILGMNYGEAGAVEYFSRKYPSPKVFSMHNNYWFWINELDKVPSVIIVIGGNIEDHLQSCESVEQAGFLHHPYSMPYENRPVYICRKLKVNIFKIWNAEKHFI